MTTAGNKGSILIIDDDTEIRYSLHRVLSSRHYAVATASSGEEGVAMAEKLKPQVIFLDNRMEGMSGLEALQHIRGIVPNTMVILMTAFGTTQTAIEAMKFGAFDYIIKPFDIKRVLSLTESAQAAHRDLSAAEGEYNSVLNSDDYQEGIVGSSEAMQAVFKTIGQVAASDVTVMITGESGTGKELVARCIYQHSHRSVTPYMAVNCAAIPENLIESELFGHEKGSFTGATNQRLGKFELCDGGTLFLDEIGDMSLPTQTKILRALQEGEIQRVGGTSTRKVDVRLIAATNKNLESMVEAGEFREDLYYRLNVVRIRLPRLADRREDVPELIDFMIQRLAKAGKVRVRGISKEALDLLSRYGWPGNVRELENIVSRSGVVAQGETILVKDLPKEVVAAARGAPEEPETEMAPPDESAEEPTVLIGKPSTPVVPVANGVGAGSEASAASTATAAPIGAPTVGDMDEFSAVPVGDLGDISLQDSLDLLYKNVRKEFSKSILQEIEREMIQRALIETGGNQVKTSALLGITRATLRKRIDQHSLRY